MEYRPANATENEETVTVTTTRVMDHIESYRHDALVPFPEYGRIPQKGTLGRVTYTSRAAHHEDAEREELEATIVATMAGKAAQLLLPRDDLTEDLDFEHYWFGGDKESIIDWLLVLGLQTNEGELNEVEPYAEFLWRRTINITRRAGVRQSLEAIAGSLLERVELDDKELLEVFLKVYAQHAPLPTWITSEYLKGKK